MAEQGPTSTRPWWLSRSRPRAVGPELHDLTPSQRLSVLNRRYTVHKQVVNIATSVTVKAALDPHRLETAVRLAVSRWDSFGLRFVRAGKDFRQYFSERACLGVEHRDFSGADADAMERFFLREASRPMRLTNAPQARFVVFVTPEGWVGLFSVVSHLILDSWSISRFYRDVVELYAALADGTALPAEPHSFEPLLRAENDYQHSARCAEDRAFWEAEFSGTPATFVSLRGSGVLAAYRAKTKRPDARECGTVHLRTKADHVVTRVAASDVTVFSQYAATHRTSLQVLFQLALRLYLSKVNGRPSDILLGVNVARRGTLAEKNSGGCRVQHIKFRADLPETLTFAEACKVLGERQGTYFRHMDFSSYETQFMSHRLHGTRPGTGYFDVHMTFQPLPMVLGDWQCATRWYCNGATSLPAYLTVMDDDGTGGLRCYWERNVRHMPASTIEACHAFMLSALRAGVERPSITLGELMDLG